MLSRASMMTSLETLKTSFALDIKLFEESVSRDIGTEGTAKLSAEEVAAINQRHHDYEYQRFQSRRHRSRR
jgi:hypothetical protein